MDRPQKILKSIESKYWIYIEILNIEYWIFIEILNIEY